ncbi:GspE/PulE family protein [Mucisphaera sp.]|uniref:GspE/PulE family protein n=1 Tax=Mucisphaera sp. TaxID=2913024 RepID=UPI003D148FBE
MSQIPPHTENAAPKRVRIGDILLAKQLVTQDQINAALEHQRSEGRGKLLGQVLIELGMVTEQQTLEAVADALDIPFARLGPGIVDTALSDLLPAKFLAEQIAAPLFQINGLLTLAVNEPTDVFLIEEVERITQSAVQIVVATSEDIRDAQRLLTVGTMTTSVDDIVRGSEFTDDIADADIADITEDDITAGSSPVIKLVNHVLYQAIRERASDIHIEPGDKSLRVRFRVDGRLDQRMTPPAGMLAPIASRIKIMAGMDISEKRIPQDGGISIHCDGRAVDLRVSTMPGRYGEKIVIRIIDASNALVELESLGLSPNMLRRYLDVVQQPNGIVLVTGPTGSGKSTTLYATLRQVVDPTRNVSTVEDPVEYGVEGVNQFQVNDKTGFTFSSALRALLRQDPDVIMVGEIRDAETARIATQAALTGHLVLSTLHTNDAPAAITRLVNIGVEPYLIAASVRAVMAQRLVRRLCINCREPGPPTDDEKRFFDRIGGPVANLTEVQHAVGCSQCFDTGYRGRLGIYELYTPSDEALDAVCRGASLQELRQIASASNDYISLRDDGIDKVVEGHTTIQELLTATAL